MEVGDLVRKVDEELWLVHKVDLSLGTVFLSSETNKSAVIDLEEKVEILCNPSRTWPFLILPMRKGRLIEIRQGNKVLNKLQHWVKMDDWQLGGSLFLNPELGLGYRDRLVISRGNGRTLNVDIPRNFTAGRRQVVHKVKTAPTKEPNLFDHLMDD